MAERCAVLSNVSFIENAAQAGGAIFTNDPRRINATADPEAFNARSLVDVWNNQSYREAAMLRFDNNSNAIPGRVAGYGRDFATTPIKPTLKACGGKHRDEEYDRREERSNLVIEAFSSGSRLEFTISFRDALDQDVNISMSLTASIVHDALSMKGEELELSGQSISEMDEHGNMTISGTRLRGNPNVNYTLRVDYSSHDDSLTYVVRSSNVTVQVVPCRLGEKTVTHGAVTECARCPIGEFGKHPEEGTCVGCADVDNGRCNGDTVIPDAGYWHSTSTSLKMYPCIGAESCDSSAGRDQIQRTASASHAAGQILHYMNESDILCKTVPQSHNEHASTQLQSFRATEDLSAEAARRVMAEWTGGVLNAARRHRSA